MAENKTNRATIDMLGARRHSALRRLLYEAGLMDPFYTERAASSAETRDLQHRLQAAEEF